MKKFKTALLSTAALVAVAAFASHRPVAAESLSQLIDQIEDAAGGQFDRDGHHGGNGPNSLRTKTPIKHLVVIFNENISFDHYFGTYPTAANTPGEPAFTPAGNTPSKINNYNLPSNASLLTANNPNLLNPNNPATNATFPFRLDRTQAVSGDQGHAYTAEQKAYDGGKNDLFPLDTGNGTGGGAGAFGSKWLVMGYYDGNTVTAFWNYAQNYAMSDNSWSDQYGPSTPGALNMFAGQTNGGQVGVGNSANLLPNTDGSFTLNGDADPTGDSCSSKSTTVSLTGKNIGDLLNEANIPWGSFMGGFNLQIINGGTNTTGCSRSTNGFSGTTADYVPHHAWFQYYASTANLSHARPTSTKAIGYTKVPGTQTIDPANHAYDLEDFTAAVGSGNYPAVSFIKLPAYQDGHGGYSNPLDEQTGVVNLINFLQEQPDWDSTAVIIAYDDSDGWYDHAFANTTRGSFAGQSAYATLFPSNANAQSGALQYDALNGAGLCGILSETHVPAGLSGQPVNGRCGPGTRQPFLVISPYAKQNYVSHVLITQASIPQFIEDNWLEGKRIGGGSFDATTGSIADMFDFDRRHSEKLILDATYGTVDSRSKIRN